MKPIVKRRSDLSLAPSIKPTTLAVRPIALLGCCELNLEKLPFSLHPASHVIKNFGNTINLEKEEFIGELASLELAISEAGVSDIVILGHTACSAIRFVVCPEEWSVPEYESFAALNNFKKQAKSLTECLRTDYSTYDFSEKVNTACQEHVLIQAERLKGLEIAKNRNIYCWVFKDEVDKLFSYHSSLEQFS